MIAAAALAALALAAQPAHPARVAEALAPAVATMQVEVGLPERVAGVHCSASVINGRQSRAVQCTITMREANPATVVVRGTLGPGACLRPRIFEDYSGCVTVPTHARGTWAYRFSAVGR